ncbi:MAG: nickel-dependent lactate racemase [Armatimonadetes bacterium]|nr:nickel-dependent lactate racemase [Armatimonadota bacterium]
MRLTLRYGRNGLDVTLPDRNVAHVLHLNPLPPLLHPRQAVMEGLRQPIGAPPLAELAHGRRDAAIVISDLTRPVPNALILPPILETLAEAGLPPERVLLLVATGLHRGNTPDELAEMLGPEIMASGVRIENHAARDAGSHLDLGRSPRGIPVQVDRRYVEADLKVLTGLIEPHLMAGYSGGRKAICPGLCGVETVLAWHSPPMLDPPEACAGNLWCNPVHEEALAIADLAGGADFIVNVVLDEARQVTGVFCGDMREAHLAGMEQAERQAKVVVPEAVDIVVTTSAGYPLDLTFYQGVKGMLAALPILKPGGTLIIAQENAEGIGGPEFTELILGEPDLEHFMARAFRGEVCVIDQWQLQEMQKVTCRARVLNVSTGLPAEVQRDLFVEPFPTVEAAVTEALTHHGPDAQIAVIPEGPYVLACLPDDLVGRQTVREMVEG